MVLKKHKYSRLAERYDLVELGGGEGPFTSNFIDKILKRYKIKTVLDMTCGTGAQVIGLAKKGYKVSASDLNKDMLNIAKKKAKKKKLKIKFHLGDIRTARYGKFDAVISMFNAIGHLTKKDFEKAMKNVSENLNKNGLYIFDIFNLDFMKSGGFTKHEFIDMATEHKGMKLVRFNKNKLNVKKGILTLNQKEYSQEGQDKLKIIRESWDMKIYGIDELKKMLGNTGFKLIQVYGGENKKFHKKKSLSIVIVARRVK